MVKGTILILILASGASFAFGQFTHQDTLIFNSFKQDVVAVPTGKGGNCVSIALIKAAIGTYGMGKVFDLVTDDVNKQYNVTLKSGKQLTLSYDEATMASKKAHFFQKLPAADAVEVTKYADLCFAVMCKKLQADTSVTITYEQAVDRLNKGYVTLSIPKLLGVTINRITDLNYNNLKQYHNLVVWYSAHTVYYGLGYYDEENYKYPGMVSLTDFHHCRWYQFGSCSPDGAFALQ